MKQQVLDKLIFRNQLINHKTYYN